MNNLENLPDILFSPLSKDYCLYFYAVSVFAFVIAVIALLNIVLLLFSKGPKKQLMGAYFMLFLVYFVLYFQNRLLNTMCEKALQV